MTYEKAMALAEKWAVKNQLKVFNAPHALIYIRNIDLARREACAMGIGANAGEATQLLYVLSNLTYWRGEDAKDAKVAIKAHVKELQRRK
jgi:hypothetical protein